MRGEIVDNIPKLKDIAKQVGVSIATVSRALNNKPGVGPELRKKILRAAEKTGYTVNILARGMKTRTTATIGILLSDISNPFFAAVVSSMEKVLYPRHYNLILCNTNENPEKEKRYVNLLFSKHVDGILISPVGGRSSESLCREAVRRQRKIVFFDRVIKGIEADAVVIDNRVGMYEAIRYLVNQGHKKIACVAGNNNIYTSTERESGYRESMKHFLPDVQPVVAYGNYREKDSYTATLNLLSNSDRPTAILTANNLTSIGAIRAIKALGMRIPEDISFIGFDDLAWASIYSPPLTVISQPVDIIGITAASLLLRHFEEPTPEKPQKVLLKPELIIRNSVQKI
ncbi:MAG: LacI family transcriptional regulator [Thermotoga sp.]|nr:MAG: LacI family transcriptional regulator [Thermotoga sp.]